MKELKNCQKCGLSEYRKNIVIGKGVGDPPYDILFMGEGPGKTEDYKGKPFVGVSGRLLDKIISRVREDLFIDFTYYVTNTVLCRPTNRKNGKNRKPKAREVLACRENIEKIIKQTDPQLIVLLGNVAQDWYSSELSDRYEVGELYHPAYLVRGGGVSHPRYPMTVRKLKELIREKL